MSDDKRARLRQWLESGEARVHPLTFSQRELWEASPALPGDVSNHICAVIEVCGAVAPEACLAGLQLVVDRQEALRVSILPGKDQPMQLIRTRGEAAMKFREVPPSHSSPEAVEELAEEIFHTPFDMVRGPLYRVEALRRAADDQVWVFAIHHAIADGWTLGTFVQDLAAAYLQGLLGLRGGLPAVPMSYSAWGAAERSVWPPAEIERCAAFWKSHLAGARRLWSTADHFAPVPQRMVSLLPAEMGRAVRELARLRGATLFTTLLAAFNVALSRWTGADDIVVGTPVANRTKQSIRETMGYVSGVVPLRNQVNPDERFADGLRTLHQRTMDSFAHAMPFAELVRALGEAPTPGCNPIFQVRFALQNHPVPDVDVRGLSLKLRMRSTGTPRFDLACEITEQGESLEVVWLFRPSMFPPSEIEELGRLFRAILSSVCRSPETRLSALPV